VLYNVAMTSTDRSGGDVSRRDALRLGAVGGGALAFTRLPPSVRRAIETDPPPGGLDQIAHVVLLMQENRSFDHYFGTLSGVQGYGDRTVLSTRAGGTMFQQPDSTGSVVMPFGVREASVRQRQDVQYIGELAHDWEDGQGAWAGGWNDGWIANETPATMAGYDRADLPLHYELADAFTICDAYFSSVKSSTSPNRNYWVSGHTGFEPGSHHRAVTNATDHEDTHPGYDWPTYAELLEAAGVTWQVYQEWDNFGDNNLEFFAPFKLVMAEAFASIDNGTYRTASDFYGSLPAQPDAERELLLASLDVAVAALPGDVRSLFERGVRRSAPGTLAARLAADITAGTLPAVSYVVPSAALSEHPGASSPIQSARVIYDVLDALASDPDVWASTAVFINYDENGGFFDHVPPPVPPIEVAAEYEGDAPIGLGVRVPMIVVSPWTVGGWVCSQVFDHTSVTQFLERWTGVATNQISAWRRTVAGDLTSVFDFDATTTSPRPAAPATPPTFADRWMPEPPIEQTMPPQEPGTRPARPLPYQPNANAMIDAGVLAVELVNQGRRPAHMVVYDWTETVAAPVHVDVAIDGVVAVPVADDTYAVTVTGPNRFVREFAGTLSGSGGMIEVSSTVSPDPLAINLLIGNTSDDEVAVTIVGQVYGTSTERVMVAAGERMERFRSVANAHGWYDVVVTVEDDPTFHRRLTGHIETGRPSVTG